MKPLRKSVFQCSDKNQPKGAIIQFYCLFDESHVSNVCFLILVRNNTGPAISGGPGGMSTPPPTPTPHPPTPIFLRNKKKKGKQRKKRKNLKVETIKSLSPKSKCFFFSHSRVSRIQKLSLLDNHGGRQYFSVFHGLSNLKSISPAL